MLKSVKLAPSNIDGMPQFEFREEAISSIVGRVSGALVGLLVLTALAAFLAMNSLRRYPLVG
jgi:hypothetical protein